MDQLAGQLQAIAEGSAGAKGAQETLAQKYLGFVVVKPLVGAPVGKTVLKPFPHKKGDGHLRNFGSVRDYKVHFLGFSLSVSGLAFQQQDEGVSACATTAIWSALQKIRDFEDLRSVSPAEITSLATRHTLPFGRAMPQEGLTIDQMCQAIQALGLAPSLYRIEAAEDLFAYLHAAERSNFPSILVLDNNPSNPKERHGVAVVGLKSMPRLITNGDGVQDIASGIRALYVHDDRYGPYVRFDVESADSRSLTMSYPEYPKSSAKIETWWVSYLLVPVHHKIRLSFATLCKASRMFAVAVREAICEPKPLLSFEYFVQQGNRYVEDMCKGPNGSRRLGFNVAAECALPRYLGVLRVAIDTSNWIDLLLDTTCTPRNIGCVAIVCSERTGGLLTAAASKLAGVYACKAFTSQ